MGMTESRTLPLQRYSTVDIQGVRTHKVLSKFSDLILPLGSTIEVTVRLH